MNFIVLTLFPDLFPGPLAASITGAALEKKLWNIEAVNIRSYAKDKHQTVDDTPYGGGAGMLLKADVLGEAIDDQLQKIPQHRKKKLVYLSPRGKVFSQKIAQEMAKYDDVLLLCGRYEGVDQRVLDHFEIEEISIGDYVLSGGEMAAYVVIDAILRNVSGVLGADDSLSEESFGDEKNKTYENLLEYPHFTRPSEWRGRKVPEILTQGHHKKIEQWRLEQAKEITQKNRPDIFAKFLAKKE